MSEVSIEPWTAVDAPAGLPERAYAIVSGGQVVGSASVDDVGVLQWEFADIDERLAVLGVDALIEFAFGELGLHRVQARLGADDSTSASPRAPVCAGRASSAGERATGPTRSRWPGWPPTRR